jgi:hypothetical protein
VLLDVVVAMFAHRTRGTNSSYVVWRNPTLKDLSFLLVLVVVVLVLVLLASTSISDVKPQEVQYDYKVVCVLARLNHSRGIPVTHYTTCSAAG